MGDDSRAWLAMQGKAPQGPAGPSREAMESATMRLGPSHARRSHALQSGDLAYEAFQQANTDPAQLERAWQHHQQTTLDVDTRASASFLEALAAAERLQLHAAHAAEGLAVADHLADLVVVDAERRGHRQGDEDTRARESLDRRVLEGPQVAAAVVAGRPLAVPVVLEVHLDPLVVPGEEGEQRVVLGDRQAVGVDEDPDDGPGDELVEQTSTRSPPSPPAAATPAPPSTTAPSCSPTPARCCGCPSWRSTSTARSTSASPSTDRSTPSPCGAWVPPSQRT